MCLSLTIHKKYSAEGKLQRSPKMKKSWKQIAEWHGLPISHLSSLWLIFKVTIIAWCASKHLQGFQCTLIAAYAASSQQMAVIQKRLTRHPKMLLNNHRATDTLSPNAADLKVNRESKLKPHIAWIWWVKRWGVLEILPIELKILF